MLPPPPRSTLFPYTTLFRSDEFIISVVPTFIGEGIPLIAPRHREVPLRLRSVQRFPDGVVQLDRKSTRLNSSHPSISYAVFCLKKKTLILTVLLSHLPPLAI